MNIFRTGLLLAGLTGLFLAVGFLIAGEMGLLIALGVSIAMNVFAYWNSDKMVLRMHNAEEVDHNSNREFFSMIEQLAKRADLPMPKVYIMHEDQPNAFATGRNPENAAVAATTGLMRTLSKEEIAGVMAHELAHIKNRDTLIMTITATIAGAISMLANFGLFFGRGRDNPLGIIGTLAMVILAPLAAMLVQMAISRTREYAADRLGAEICGNPMWLASALDSIEYAAHQSENEAAEANPATAHMFIINPLSGARMDNLFSTHPDTGNRIAALADLAEEWGMDHDEPEPMDQEPARATPGSGPAPWSRAGSGRPAKGRQGPWG